METPAHSALKRLALGWLRDRGCLAAAEEVRAPIGRYRVDVAGYRDTVPAGRDAGRRCPPATIVIECKQARSDFLRDGARRERLLRERGDLEAIARHMEEHRIRREEPQLRRAGTALFPEMEEWDFAASRLGPYHDVVRRLASVDRRLYGHVKFTSMRRYRLADELYVAALPGLVRRGELPAGWGLLEARGGRLEVRLAAPQQGSSRRYRHGFLRNIAVAASRGGVATGG